MKLTALAVVILAVGIVLGLALAEGSLGGPASAVPQCPGPSSQCPTPPEPAAVVTDRAFFRSGFGTQDLIDSDDGSLIATFSGVSIDASNCDDTRALLTSTPDVAVSLIDTSDGQVLGVYTPPFPGATREGVFFSCVNLDWLNAGLQVVRNRATVSWQDPLAPFEKLTLLVDTDTGQVIASFPGLVAPEGFNCVGDRISVPRVGMFDAVTGAIIIPLDPVFGGVSFICNHDPI